MVLAEELAAIPHHKGLGYKADLEEPPQQQRNGVRRCANYHWNVPPDEEEAVRLQACAGQWPHGLQDAHGLENAWAARHAKAEQTFRTAVDLDVAGVLVKTDGERRPTLPPARWRGRMRHTFRSTSR